MVFNLISFRCPTCNANSITVFIHVTYILLQFYKRMGLILSIRIFTVLLLSHPVKMVMLLFQIVGSFLTLVTNIYTYVDLQLIHNQCLEIKIRNSIFVSVALISVNIHTSITILIFLSWYTSFHLRSLLSVVSFCVKYLKTVSKACHFSCGKQKYVFDWFSSVMLPSVCTCIINTL